MKLYFAGSEIPAWRRLLADEGVKTVSLSFTGLAKRVIHLENWRLEEKYPEDQEIFLDSGAFSFNKPGSDYTGEEAARLEKLYLDFVTLNKGRPAMVSEFDAMMLGREHIESRRTFYEDLFGHDFIPVWHSEFGGLEELERMCARYSRVLITETSLDGQDLTSVLNNLAGMHGTRFHGAMTKTDLMQSVKWDSVGSTSWMSPKMHGDTAVWTGSELKRYPANRSDQARIRHQVLIEQAGFDAQAIIDGDDDEVLRLSIWSWQQYVAFINNRSGVTTRGETPVPGNTEQDTGAVDNQLSISPNGQLVIQRETQLLPLLEPHRNEHGESVFAPRSQSMRMCNTCILRNTCPGYQADANCLYDIPLKFRTPEQQKSALDGIIEMQFQRVMFMQMKEQQSGGYADENLSKEIDRFQKLISTRQKLDEEGETLVYKRRGTPNRGALSGLFGDQVAQQISAAEYPAEHSVDEVIVEAQIVDEP